MKYTSVINKTLFVLLFVRFLFLLLKEPFGHWNMMQLFPESVYIAWLRWSIVISTGLIVPIMLGVMLYKRWAYLLTIGMGIFHIVWMTILTVNESAMGLTKFVILFVYTTVFMVLSFIMLKRIKNESSEQALFCNHDVNVFLGIRIFYISMLFLIMSSLYLYRDFGGLFVVAFMSLAVCALIIMQDKKSVKWRTNWMTALNTAFYIPLLIMLVGKIKKLIVTGDGGQDPMVVISGVGIDTVCIAGLLYNTARIQKNKSLKIQPKMKEKI